ncbi:helix-turn-helix domain-containing protein [Robinsoniella peoriensis]|uniref:helix-turn-helix domain-containing protein n=1 Tax=Robinsoniella peoriensis TaxID=180332 RepID=UPI003640BA07
MAADHSFTEYVAKRFDNDFWAVAEQFLDDNQDSLSSELQRIHSAGDMEISDVKVEHVWVEDLPGMKIQFDVALSIWYEIAEGNHHYDDLEDRIVWIMARCKGDLNSNLDDFEIFHVSSYNGKNRVKNPMDDSLVPVMYPDKLDEVAEQFLREHYKKALLQPTWVNPLELAESMGLCVKFVYITKDETVFGRSYFFDSDVELYNPDSDSFYTEHIPAGTILVDKAVAFMYVLGATNNTIIHECVHWDKHKKAFALARLYNAELTNIACKVVGGIVGNHSEQNAVDWMEWQANALTPKIQLPMSMFKKYVDGLISQYRRELNAYDMIDIIEPIIIRIEEDFGVSKVAAKIRMLEVGYEEAAGAFTYIDGRYVKPHKAAKGFLQKNQTFSVLLQDALIESTFNLDLKAKVAGGSYKYIDSHFVLNHPQYVEKDIFGNEMLTHYARNHMDECCLVFSLTVKSKIGDRYRSECFLNRDKSSEIVFEAHFSAESGQDANHAKMIKDYNADLLSVAKKLPMNFSGALDALIVWSEMTEEELAEAADMSEKTIQRLRNSEPDNVTIETVVQLCIGMKLPPVLSGCLLRASGKSFMMTEQHLMYQFLLNSCYYKTIYDCNDMLTAQNLKPLGRQNRIA